MPPPLHEKLIPSKRIFYFSPLKEPLYTLLPFFSHVIPVRIPLIAGLFPTKHLFFFHMETSRRDGTCPSLHDRPSPPLGQFHAPTLLMNNLLSCFFSPFSLFLVIECYHFVLLLPLRQSRATPPIDFSDFFVRGREKRIPGRT